MLSRISCAVAFLGAALVASSAPAALVAYEGFNYPLGSITGGNGGTGFSSPWTGAGDVIGPNSLFYSNGGNGGEFSQLATSGARFRTAGNNVGAFRTLSAPIDTDSGTVWLGFLANQGTNVPPAYSGVSFFSGGTSTEEVFFGVPSNQAKYGFDVTGAPGGVMVKDTAFQDNPFSSSFVVYRLNFTPNGETLDFFYRPPEGVTPTTPDATFAIPEGTFADTLTALRIQSGNGNGNFNGTEFDEIRIGTTYVDVAPAVPEPAALGLLCVVVPLALRRRR